MELSNTQKKDIDLFINSHGPFEGNEMISGTYDLILGLGRTKSSDKRPLTDTDEYKKRKSLEEPIKKAINKYVFSKRVNYTNTSGLKDIIKDFGIDQSIANLAQQYLSKPVDVWKFTKGVEVCINGEWGKTTGAITIKGKKISVKFENGTMSYDLLEIMKGIQSFNNKECEDPSLGTQISVDGSIFDINIFDILDKNEKAFSINDRIKQYFTFMQLPIFDTIHDMIVDGNIKDTGVQNRYLNDLIKSYQSEMLSLLDSLNKKQKTNYFDTPKRKSQVNTLMYIQNNIYTNYNDPDTPDYYMYGMFKTGKEQDEYKKDLLGYSLKNEKDKTNLGANVSNIYIINAIEILSVRPCNYNTFGRIFNNDFNIFLRHVTNIRSSNNITNKSPVLVTIDIPGRQAYLGNMGPYLGGELGNGDVKIYDLATPAKVYDSAGNSDELFKRTADKPETGTITLTGNTRYNLYFRCEYFERPFAKFDLLNNGKQLKLYQFGTSNEPNGITTGTPDGPENSTNAAVAMMITSLYKKKKNKDIRFYSFFKFGGDFIQGVWQYILSYPSEIPDITFKTVFNANKQYFNCIKIHLSTDGLSAAIASLFGGFVLTSNTKYWKLEDGFAGGTEFFFVTTEMFKEMIKSNKKVLSDYKLIEQSAKNIYKDYDKKNFMSESSFVDSILVDLTHMGCILNIIKKSDSPNEPIPPYSQYSTNVRFNKYKECIAHFELETSQVMYDTTPNFDEEEVTSARKKKTKSVFPQDDSAVKRLFRS
jgi:hypothetical protein